MSNNEMCEGCIIDNNRVCNRISIQEKKQCPCSICLVKSMCQNVCEEFRNYMDKYIGRHYE